MSATRTVPAILAVALLLAGCPGAEREVDPAAQPDTAPWLDTLPQADGPLGPAPPDRLAPTPPDPPPATQPGTEPGTAAERRPPGG
jgi:hypothetical protein